ncbi:MAG: alkaline phosphatase family protein [Syntrophales bacterium]
MHKKFSRFSMLLLVLPLVFLAYAGMQAQPAYAEGPAGQAVAKRLVLICLDSCRLDYLDLTPTPNIDKLKAEGTFYTRAWVGQLANDTPPSHTSMATGRFGKNTSVISFNWRDARLLPWGWDFRVRFSKMVMGLVKATGWTDLGLWYLKNVVRKSIEQNFITSYENVVAGKMNSFIRESGSNSIGSLYKKVHSGARVAAVSCDKWYACAGLAADDADVTVFAEAKGAPPVGFNDISRLKPAGIMGKLPPDHILNDVSLVRDWEEERDSDVWATDVAVRLIEQMAPEVLMINLPAIDDAGHETGGITAPQRMAEVVANADRQVGRIVEAYKKAGKYDETLFVIISDHGMTPFTLTSSQAALDRVLIEAGNFANASPHIYLLFPEKAGETAEIITNAKLPGINGAYYKMKQADGKYVYKPSATTAKRITGDLDRCFRYLLDTYAGPTSPDIELVMSENSHLDWTMFGHKPYLAQHDSTTWLAQNIILLFAGPGVKKGVVSDSPARLVDVAPTALTLMGFVPERMDGIVLSDALQSPTARQIHTQMALNNELVPMVEALKELSKADIAALKAK